MSKMQDAESEDEGACCCCSAASAGSARHGASKLSLCVRLALWFVTEFESREQLRKAVQTELGAKLVRAMPGCGQSSA